MPSSFLNQLRMMFRSTATSRASALANNYTYVNEDKVSRSLICPICLDPLLDPQTHVLCENSFCNRCIRKLRQCPCCRATIANAADLKMTSHVLRNILDELEVQCNVCRQIVQRGNFASHIRDDCLQHSLITPEEEQSLMNLSALPPTTSNLAGVPTVNDPHIEKHLSNLYRRVHALESELFELKKAIYVCLFVMATIATLLFFGFMFSYLIWSFFSVFLTIWLPSFVHLISVLLFDFSPSTTLLKMLVTGLYFLLVCHKRRPSDVSLITIIVCSSIVLLNALVLIGHLVVNYFSFLFTLTIAIIIGRHFHVELPNCEQFASFFNELHHLQERRRSE